jgi:hypothetical protein
MRMVKSARVTLAATIGLMFLSAALTFAGSAKARTLSQCVSQHTSCLQNCDRYPNGPFHSSCLQRCGSKLDYCLLGADADGKVETPPDPLHPKGTGGHTPPTGGTQGQPKASPKVNDTRPPLGGGVFQPKSSGAGNSGPILHSGGSPGPILKSSGGNGPSLQFGGRH